MGGTDETSFHRGGSLDGDELIHQSLVKTATKLTERLREDKVSLRARRLVLLESTVVHHGKVRAQAVADGLIGSAHFMFEQLQSQQYSDWHRGSSTWGTCGEACGKTALNGRHQSSPGKGIGPLANGMGVRHKVGHLQGQSRTAQPMLKAAQKAH